jgi:hypothetical protein
MCTQVQGLLYYAAGSSEEADGKLRLAHDMYKELNSCKGMAEVRACRVPAYMCAYLCAGYIYIYIYVFMHTFTCMRVYMRVYSRKCVSVCVNSSRGGKDICPKALILSRTSRPK